MNHALDNMKSLDIYVDSIAQEEYEKIKDLLYPESKINANLLSFEFHLQNLDKLFKGASVNKDIFSLNYFSKTLSWKNNIEKILTQNPFEALVLTDINRNILWVNDGFTTMTGYPKNYAINKTPSFLQGKSTSQQTRTRIRKKLTTGLPFKEVIINHRKDQTTYKCEIHIFPLTKNNEVTHFLALEKQIA
ncbi:PAS domain-containing protein [Tenacibaculum agarivorans]|uniref:PAS domain-containing protein n=1 Tax=Tenacibaculum agarivorans TaxID=1908389 RepID=UPI00094BAE58|nr:PAS domain-containing protein [Tenacibaculum agarivorans]